MDKKELDKELVKALRACAKGCECSECPYDEEACPSSDDMFETAADTIERLTKEKEELISRFPKWIGVKDELPSPTHPSDPDYRPYLIIADGYMYFADYSYDKYFETCYSFYVDGEEMTGVTHWCKIPEPPKGE